jgi:hypothetical protein
MVKKQLILALGAALTASVAALVRRRQNAQADAALWREATGPVQQPSAQP